MDLGQQLWLFLSDPHVAYLALVVGLVMLLVAVTTPGTGVAEAIALIALAIAAIGLIQLSANFAGVVLIIVAFVLFLIDATATSHGLLTLAGAGAFLFGSLLLFPVREGAQGLSGWLIGGVTLATGAFSALVLSAFARVRKQKRIDSAAQQIIGQRGIIKSPIQPKRPGTAQVAGQLWTVSADEAIEANTEVEVYDRVGLTLLVRRVKPSG